MISESRLLHLNQKGIKSDYSGSAHTIGNGHTIFGLKVASKVFTIIYGTELGKPVVLPNIWGRNTARCCEGTADRGYDKKRMSVCNGLNRGICLDLKRC